ncbi:MAG TPA: sugar phosphate isomerase/epimerase family protein [Terriglobia bacterium]|nr:sugar phosphate isomerase/epimerase family protein [Terriglobia bacterium]
MEFGVSTRLCYSDRLDVDQLERFRRAGFGRIEIYGNAPHFDYRSRQLRQGIARWFEENELPPPSLHLPFEERVSPDYTKTLSALAPESGARQEAMDEIKRCLELAERLRLAYVTLHLGVPGQPFSPACFDHAYAAVAQIQAFSGVRVLIENIPNEISTLSRIRELIVVADLPETGICYDTAHGPSSRGLDFGSEGAGPVVALQLSDRMAPIGSGDEPERLWPFEGKIRWPAFIEKLALSSFDGPLIFETDGGIGKAHDVCRRLDELRAEAENSIDEFRLKYRLPVPGPPET